jgi:hypothetical protein
VPYYYVYHLKHLPTNCYYIGSRKSQQIPNLDLGSRYYSSSRIIKKEYQTNPQDFAIKIVRTFDDYKSALLFEHKLLRRCGVPYNLKLFNRCVWQNNHIHTLLSNETKEQRRTSLCGPRPNGRHPHSTIGRKIHFAQLGKIIPSQTRLAVSKANKTRIWTKEQRAKISERMKGNKFRLNKSNHSPLQT